jgi:hypothetical protein
MVATLSEGRIRDRYAGVGAMDEIIAKYLFAEDSWADFRRGNDRVKWAAGNISCEIARNLAARYILRGGGMCSELLGTRNKFVYG